MDHKDIEDDRPYVPYIEFDFECACGAKIDHEINTCYGCFLCFCDGCALEFKDDKCLECQDDL